MKHRVTVTTDDFGLTRHITDTILETVDNGPVTNVSVMPNGNAFDYAVEEYLKRREKLSLSVHLNLTEGRPISNPKDVPLLVDSNGLFKHSVGGFWIAYLFSSSRKEFRAQIRREIQAQIRRVRAALKGEERIASVNGHQHVHMLPFVFDALISIPDVPPIRLPHEAAYVPGIVPFVAAWKQLPKWLMLMFLCRRVRRQRKFFNDSFVGVLYSGRMTRETTRTGLLRAVSIDENSHTEILFHPGSALMGELDEWKSGHIDTEWHYSLWRRRERELLLDSRVRDIIKGFEDGSLEGSVFDPLKIFRFLVSGTLAAATHLGLLYLLTEYAGIWYVLSSTVGWGGGFIVSFTLQKYWTFENHSHQLIGQQAIRYFLLQGFNLFLNGTLLFFLTDTLGVWYLLSQFVILLVLAVWTYVVSQRFIFHSSRAAIKPIP